MSSLASQASKTDPSEHVPVTPVNVQDGQDVVRLTPKAIAMARAALVKRGTPSAWLRLGVRGGGCSGVSYAIEFSDKSRERDHIFEFDDLRVLVDPKSLVYLRGAVLDYEVKLMQHGFKFINPNEKSGCGCGESFAI